MPPSVIEVQKASDVRDVVHRAVQALVEGGLVVFPTETVYGVAASALHADAVQRLVATKSRDEQQPFAICVKSAEDAWDYVPQVSTVGRRLARRCWPGPVTLVIPDSHPDSLLHRLPPSVQQVVGSTGSIGLRVPAHRLILDVLDMLAGPIVLSSANRAGHEPAVTAQQAIEALRDDVRLVLDDGECRFGQPSSVLRVDADGRLTVVRAGFVSEPTLQRLAALMIVVVCTGNTCRSPLAEVMLRKLLADKLGCTVEQLDDRGVMVMSAGIAAMSGSRASVESVEVARKRNLPLDDHVSQPVTDRLVRHADLIFTMTRGHRAGLLSHWPEAANRTHLLCPEGRDVSDPIGGPLEMYERCADQIEQALIRRVEQLELTRLLPTFSPS